MLEEKRREELLRNSYTYNSNQNRTDTSLMLDHEQQELRHHNRLANANTSKLIKFRSTERTEKRILKHNLNF